jgi:hypothetical protein
LDEQERQIIRPIERPKRLQDGVRALPRLALADIAAEFPLDIGSTHRLSREAARQAFVADMTMKRRGVTCGKFPTASCVNRVIHATVGQKPPCASVMPRKRTRSRSIGICREGPQPDSCTAANDRLAMLHSITSSASAFAVLRRCSKRHLTQSPRRRGAGMTRGSRARGLWRSSD